jgi:hypothetical protein
MMVAAVYLDVKVVVEVAPAKLAILMGLVSAEMEYRHLYLDQQ